MSFRPQVAVMALCLPALVAVSPLAAHTRRPRKGLVRTAKEAMAIAERETGGQAVSARRIPLNGASGGWEVDVRMPHDKQGWRCIVDCDTRMVFTKTHIDNPPPKSHRTGTHRSTHR